MSTKTCKFCGWEFPVNYRGTKCTICGTPFDILMCSVCGEQKPVEEFATQRSVCKACRVKQATEWRKGHFIRMDERFDEWIAKVKSVPKNYPSLTEAQWLEACRHFDGCARCESKDIDARGFFISAKLGGRYCDWNVIPLCEKCASNWNLEKSVFKYTEKRAYNTKNLDYKRSLTRIVEYLGGKLDNAVATPETGKNE